MPPLSPGWGFVRTPEELQSAVGVLSKYNPPAYFQLPEGQQFLLGHLMRSDGLGFLVLDHLSVTLAGLGAGATLDAEQIGRFFSTLGGNLTLINLRMVNGLAQARQIECCAQRR